MGRRPPRLAQIGGTIVSEHFSNGTEGYAWMANWCDRCANDHTAHIQTYEDGGCEVLLRELVGEPVPEFIEGTGRLGDTVHCLAFRPCDECNPPGEGDDQRPPRIPIHPDQGFLFDPTILPSGVPAGVLLDEGLPSVLNPPVRVWA